MSQHSRKSPIEIGLAYLDALIKKDKEKGTNVIPAAIAEAYLAGKKEVIVGDFYSRKRLSSLTGGINDFILPADQLLVGTTNIDKGKIPVGEFMIATGVSVKYAFNSTNGGVGLEPGSQEYANSGFIQAVPVPILTSEFTFKNGNRKILECLTDNFFKKQSVSSVGSANSLNCSEDNMLMLPQPKLITPDKLFSVQFNIPTNGLAVALDATHNHFIEFRTFGIRLIDRTEG